MHAIYYSCEREISWSRRIKINLKEHVNLGDNTAAATTSIHHLSRRTSWKQSRQEGMKGWGETVATISRQIGYIFLVSYVLHDPSMSHNAVVRLFCVLTTVFLSDKVSIIFKYHVFKAIRYQRLTQPLRQSGFALTWGISAGLKVLFFVFLKVWTLRQWISAFSSCYGSGAVKLLLDGAQNYLTTTLG